MENNSNRKKILLLLFLLCLICVLLVGFFIGHYYKRAQNQDISIFSNLSNSSNSTNSNSANEIKKKCSNYIESQNYQLALQAGQNAVKLYPNSGDAHLCLGVAYNNLGYFDLSIKELKTAEKLTNNKADLEAIYEYIGADYDTLGNSNNALLYYDRELEIARDLNDQKGESYALNNIGEIYQEQGNYDKAGEYFSKSFVLTPNSIMTAVFDTHVASVCLDKGEKNTAVKFYKEAIKFYQKAGDYRDTAITMLNLGDTYTDLKNFSEAQNYLQQSLSMIQTLGNKYEEAYGYIAFGKLYLAQNQKGLAKEYFTKAYNLFKATGNNNKAQKVYEKYLK